MRFSMKSTKGKSRLIVKLRRAVSQNGTIYIALPREFVELHGIKAGDKLPVIADHILKVVPMKEIA
jgi:bifunctional DNA-binding transcriptional regulator/antitoxin component of YhaV-PrlF toxin-antitoxin module